MTGYPHWRGLHPGGWRKAPGHLRGRALQEWNLIPLEDKSTYTDAVTVLRSRVDPENRVLAGQDFSKRVLSLWPMSGDRDRNVAIVNLTCEGLTL